MKKIANYFFIAILALLFLFNSFVIYQALFQSNGCSLSMASGPSGGWICEANSIFFVASMMGAHTDFIGIAVGLLLLNLYISWVIFMLTTIKGSVYRLVNTVTPYFRPLSRKAFLVWLVLLIIINVIGLHRYIEYLIIFLFVLIQLRRFADFNNNGKWFLTIWATFFILNVLIFGLFSSRELLSLLGSKTTYSIVVSFIAGGSLLFPIFMNLILLFYPGIPKENHGDIAAPQQ